MNGREGFLIFTAAVLAVTVAAGRGAKGAGEPVVVPLSRPQEAWVASESPAPSLPSDIPPSWWEEVRPGILGEGETEAPAPPPTATASLPAAPSWTASGDEALCAFGTTVATAGDVNGDGYDDVVVGSPSYDGAGANRGRAFVFLGSPSGPSTVASWIVSGDENSAWFGISVATAGDVDGNGCSDILVGASGHDAGAGAGANRGRAYLYRGFTSGLSTAPAWVGSGDQNGCFYGSAVSAAGDTNGDGFSDAVIGAYLHDASGSDRGRAYLYRGWTGGLGTAASWTASGNSDSAQFGKSVALAGDVNGDAFADLVIGAPNHPGGGLARGQAYVYLGSATGTASSPTWVGSGGETGAAFGASVSTAGDVNGDGYAEVLVGAPLANAGVADGDRGQVFLFPGSSSGTVAGAAWTASGDENLAQLGYSVGPAGDINGDGYADVAVSAPYHDAGGISGADRGRAYLFLGSSAGLPAAADWVTPAVEYGASLGLSLFTAGDTNGDGFADLLLGAPYHDAGGGNGANMGQAYVFLGSASMPPASPGWEREGGITGVQFGSSLAMAGDVNGDGFEDLIAGTPLYGDTYHPEQGRALLFLGSATGPQIPQAWSDTGEAGSHFGRAVASAGDVNGDGYGDVIVGAPDRMYGGSEYGGAYVYYGSATGLSASFDWQSPSGRSYRFLGYSVACAGDVNGDGFSDVIIGSYDGGLGYAEVVFGSPSGLMDAPAWTGHIYPQTYTHFGCSVSSAGDVNGDGYSDIIVGASYYENGEGNEGAAFVYHGSDKGLPPRHAPNWQIEGDAVNSHLGSEVRGVGDVNGDGYSDVAVTQAGGVRVYLGSSAGLSTDAAWVGTGIYNFAGADFNGDGFSDLLAGTNQLSLFLGATSGLATTAAWTVAEDQPGEGFGLALAAAGDVNADGFPDAVVGCPYYDTVAYPDSGRILLYYGGGGSPALRFGQRRSLPEEGLISPLGRAPGEGFRLLGTGRSPFGRGGVKLEWQVVPLGTAFDPAQSAMSRAPLWTDSGLEGVELAEGAELPGGVGPHCWRARTLHNPVTTPYQRHGIWLTPASSARRETDLRKVPPCVMPTLPVFIQMVTRTGTGGDGNPTLAFEDPNPDGDVTGWNIRRGADPAANPSEWELIGWNQQDQNTYLEPITWTDVYSTLPEGQRVWYYQITSYSLNCADEGPF